MFSKALTYLYRRWARIRKDFKQRWKNYVYQSLLAFAAVTAVLWLLYRENAVVVASIGAQLSLSSPCPACPQLSRAESSAGILSDWYPALLAALIPHNAELTAILIHALAVGISIFLMVSLDMEHPPAAATALGLVINGYSTKVVLAVLTSAVILSIAHRTMRKYLRDLV
jgi:CBS-domain-containing membrane protein